MRRSCLNCKYKSDDCDGTEPCTDWAPDPETEEDWAADQFDDDVRAAVAELPPIKWPR